MEIKHDAPVKARAEQVIDAPLDQAWALLTNIAEWSRWNPGVNRVKVHGPIESGTQFEWRSGRIPISSRIEVVEPERKIAWTGRSLGMDAIHIWEFEARDDGLFARTEESLDGTLARWFSGQLQGKLQTALSESLRLLASECKRRSREHAVR